MKIAHLIIAHQDPEHIGRLALRLSSISDVYIHIDLKADLTKFSKLNTKENVHYLSNRLNINWGGWNSVAAEIILLKTALLHNKYDRLIFLQGADYPIKSNNEIKHFFELNPDVEFIRACNCTQSKENYFREKCYCYWMYNSFQRFTFIKKVWSRIIMNMHIETRNGYALGDGVKHEVFWGSAQWALTGNCAEYVVEFYDKHPKYNQWFYNCFPADELYFSTVIMNSDFSDKTTCGGPEKELKGLINWRNLHYFEYLPGRIRTFTSKDYMELKNREELYVRKVNTYDSGKLLDLLDKDNI